MKIKVDLRLSRDFSELMLDIDYLIDNGGVEGFNVDFAGKCHKDFNGEAFYEHFFKCLKVQNFEGYARQLTLFI